MKLFLRRNAPLFYALAAMLALYIPWLNRGYINLEYAFPMAAQGLSDLTESALIDAYWSNQANPLGYSLFLAAIYKLVGYHDWFWLARLPSIIGCGLMIVAGLIIFRARSSSQHQNFLLLNKRIAEQSQISDRASLQGKPLTGDFQPYLIQPDRRQCETA